MEIKFVCALPEASKQAVSIHSDGSAVLKFITDAQQMAEVLKVVPYCREKFIEVTLKTEE